MDVILSKKCALCNRLILDKKDMYLAKCNHLFHKSCFNKLKAEAVERKELKVNCPQCGAVQSFHFNGMQNEFLKSQFLSVILTPCDDNFKLQEDKKIEIQNYVVKFLKIRMFSYGFEGKIKIEIPVKYYITKVFDFLKDRNPIQIKIEYNQKRLHDKEDSQKLSLTGYIECMTSDDIQQEFDFITFNESKNGLELNSYSYILNLNFTDSFKYFFSKYKPAKIYQNKTYQSILKQHIDDLKVGEFVKINIDSDYKELSSTPKDLVVLPFINQYNSISLYDFWINTIKLYGGYLYLKDNGCYDITAVKYSEKTKSKDIDKFDKRFLRKIKVSQNKKFNTAFSVLNAIHSGGNNKNQLPSNNAKQSQALFSKSHLSISPYQSLFDLNCTFQKEQFKKEFSLEALFCLKFTGIPMYYTTLPNNEINLSKSNWHSLFGENDITLNVIEVEIKFEMIPGNRLQHHIGRDDVINDDKLKDLLAPVKDKNKKEILPFIAVSSKFKLENSESCYAWLPETKKNCYPFIVQGVITATKDLAQKYDNKYPYQIFDGSSQDPADENTEKQNNDVKVYSISNLPLHYYSYHVKLPVYKEKEDVVISAQYKSTVVSDQYYFPYRYNQPVNLELYQENAVIVSSADSSADKYTDKDKQVNSYTLGPTEQGCISFEQNSSDEVLSIIKNEAKYKTKKLITMTNKSITFSYEDDDR